MQGSETTKRRKRRGPPPFKPTRAQRRDVMLFAAGGMSEPGIAAAIGICQNTLRKHFADELRSGHEREMAANLRRLRKAADGGNVTAMKHLDGRFQATNAAAAFERPEPTTPKPGKKEEAAIAATTAGEGSDWGDDLRAPPDAPLN